MLDEIIQIDPALVKEIQWTGDPEQYDLELFELGEGLDSFLVINPWADDQSLVHYIDEIPDTNECIIWNHNGTWVAKYFTKDWYLELGYKNLEIVKPKLTWRKNQDLDRTMTFEDDPFAVYEPDPWDSQYELVWYIDPRFNPFPDKIWAISCRPMGKSTKGSKDMGYVTPRVNIEYNEELPDMKLDIDSMYPPYYDLANECAYQLDPEYTPFENIWMVKFTPAYRKPKPLMWLGTITPEFKTVYNPDLPKMNYDIDYPIPWRDFKYDHVWMLDPKHCLTAPEPIWAVKIITTDDPEGTKVVGSVSPEIKIIYNPELPKMNYDIIYDTIQWHDFKYEHLWMLDPKHCETAPEPIWAVKAIAANRPKGTKVVGDISPVVYWDFNPVLPIMSYDIQHTIQYHDFKYGHTFMLAKEHCENAPEPIWAVRLRTVSKISGYKYIDDVSPIMKKNINPDAAGYDFDDISLPNINYHEFSRRLVWFLDNETSIGKNIWAFEGTFVDDPTDYKEMGIVAPRTIIEYNPDLKNLKIKLDYSIPYHDRQYMHVWYLDKKFSGNEKIWAARAYSTADASGEKEMGIVIPIMPDHLDVIFISYYEPNAEENWQRVLEKAPWAKRVDNVPGIFEAHKAAAELAETDMFYVVDGDAYLTDQWQFNYQPGLFDRDCLYIWSSRNPINDLVYGYGGVKLFSREKFMKAKKMKDLDLATSIMPKLKVISKISNETRFNVDEFSTWRSAFREATKLQTNIVGGFTGSEESKIRLEKWKTLGVDRPYGQYSIDACEQAIDFVNTNYSKTFKTLVNINDRNWLEKEFDKRYPGVRKK
jgi:hypothetical protein